MERRSERVELRRAASKVERRDVVFVLRRRDGRSTLGRSVALDADGRVRRGRSGRRADTGESALARVGRREDVLVARSPALLLRRDGSAAPRRRARQLGRSALRLRDQRIRSRKRIRVCRTRTVAREGRLMEVVGVVDRHRLARRPVPLSMARTAVGRFRRRPGACSRRHHARGRSVLRQGRDRRDRGRRARRRENVRGVVAGRVLRALVRLGRH